MIHLHDFKGREKSLPDNIRKAIIVLQHLHPNLLMYWDGNNIYYEWEGKVGAKDPSSWTSSIWDSTISDHVKSYDGGISNNRELDMSKLFFE